MPNRLLAFIEAFFVLLMIIMLAAPAGSLTMVSGQNGAPWPMRGNTPNGSSNAQPQYTLSQKWSRAFNGEHVLTPPVAAGGKVIIATIADNGTFNVYALHADSGSIAWSKSMGDFDDIEYILKNYRAEAAISTSLGIYYVKDPRGYIRAYRLSNGETPYGWRNPSTYGSIRSGIIVMGERLFTGQDPTSPGLGVYSAKNGKPLQAYTFTYLIVCDGLPSADGNIVFLKMDDDHLYGVNLALHSEFYGDADWIIPGHISTDPIVDGSKIYYVRNNGKSEEVVAKILHPDGSTSDLWEPIPVGKVATYLAMDEFGRLFIATNNGRILIIKDGTIIKRINTGIPAKTGTNMIIMKDMLYYLSSDGRLVVVDHVLSKIVKTWRFSGEPLGMALAYGMVYVATRGGLYAYPATGKIYLRISLDPSDIQLGITVNGESVRSQEGVITHFIWTSRPIDVNLTAPYGVMLGDVKYSDPIWSYDSETSHSNTLLISDVEPWKHLELKLSYTKYLKSAVVVWISPPSLKDVVIINGSRENPMSVWIKENETEDIEVYLLPSFPYNSTHYYKFDGWDDCNCSNIRTVALKAGETVELYASYRLVKGKSIVIDLSDYGLGAELVSLVDCDEPEKVNENVGEGAITYYSVGAEWVVVEAKPLYQLNSTARLRFLYWVVDGHVVNSSRVKIYFNNQIARPVYQFELLYTLRLDSNIKSLHFTLPDGAKIDAGGVFKKWSPEPPNVTLTVPVKLQLSDRERAIYSDCYGEGVFIAETQHSNESVAIKLTVIRQSSSVIVTYRYEYLTVITVISPVKDVVTVNGSSQSWESSDEGLWYIAISSWESEPVTYILHAEDYVKLNNTGFYKFVKWADGYANATRVIVVKPGENVTVRAVYSYNTYVTARGIGNPKDVLLLVSLVFTGVALTLVARKFTR